MCKLLIILEKEEEECRASRLVYEVVRIACFEYEVKLNQARRKDGRYVDVPM